MKMKTTHTCRLIPALLFSLFAVNFSATSQTNSADGTWKSIDETSFQVSGTRYIKPLKYLTVELDILQIKSQLANVKRLDDATYTTVYIQLPKPDGTFRTYTVYENETMAKELALQFPDIRSYDGLATDNSGEVVKFDLTPQGFHAMTLTPGKPTTFIDPYSFGGSDVQHYIVYEKSDFQTEKVFSCALEALLPTETNPHGEVTPKSFGNCTKRTYRLAISATGEYTAFHGGTVALAQAAQVTTMNRVNGVYMRDLAVTMTIIGNNNLIVYTNSGTDPFTNGNPGSMITQNQSNTTSVIGSANYDVGHVFGTNSGGLAGLGVVCSNSNKARGVTGSGAPIGDPFDIDYVAHELGHQFSGNHSFRGSAGSCSGNANGTTAMEPGSGSSIMAYAGICNPQNVQSNSDDHFHGVNMNEMHNFINAGGNSCAVSTTIPSQGAPVITGTVGSVTIPINTPFALTAFATDPDGDVLTYCWEQMNNQNSTQPPVATSTTGPNFRSRSPQTSPTRYFPSIASQLTNGPYTWEVLSSVSRTFNFRCTVRDNEAGGGCNDSQDLVITTTSSAGPFIVNYPTATGITWAANSTQTVTWSVANTDQAPVSCANVDVMLSTDGGLTFTVIANDVPNDGSQDITVPSSPSTTALIIVICENGTFFDVSNNVFTITAGSPCNVPDVPTVSGDLTMCAGGSTILSIATGNLNDATDWEWTSGSCGGAIAGTGNSLVVTVPGAYYVRGTGGCVNGGSCRQVNVTQTTVNTTVFQTGGTLSVLQANATYQWLDCNNGNNPIAGETGANFSPAANGSYSVDITYNGCTETSPCFSYNSAGLEDKSNFDLVLFPNPTTGIVTLDFNVKKSIEQLSVTDISGRIISIQQELSAKSIQLDLTKEASGVYFLNITIDGQNKTYRIARN